MQYRRLFVPGGTYFFTVVTHDRRPILKEASAVQVLMDAISEIRLRHPFEMDCHVILPDHIHCIWKLPPGDSNYSTRWRLIKSRFTALCDPSLRVQPDPARIQKQQQAIWQHRFWEHLIRDARSYHRIMNYIHENPVKHGYVKRAADWPHSSIHRYIANGIHPPDGGHHQS